MTTGEIARLNPVPVRLLAELKRRDGALPENHACVPPAWKHATEHRAPNNFFADLAVTHMRLCTRKSVEKSVFCDSSRG